MKSKSSLVRQNSFDDYDVLSLYDLIADPETDEERVRLTLSSFTSYKNDDVEDYIRNKAIEFEKQSIARTRLVYVCKDDCNYLVGYFTLTNGWFNISNEVFDSKSLRKKVLKYARPTESEENEYRISAPLIAQLSKNYTNGNNELIAGDDLLAIACGYVRDAQMLLGGKITYIECEDKPELVAFYERNRFRQFGVREYIKNGEEKHLLQMLKLL